MGSAYIAPACLPETVRISAGRPNPAAGEGSRAAADDTCCVYNPTSGFYLESHGHPKELRHVKPAPPAPGLNI